MMIKLLFISHTGTGEPPMAQFIMKDLVKKAGLEEKIYVSSARFEKVGGPLCEEGRQVLKAHGVPCSPREALPLEWKTYDQYNYIYFMDNLQDPRIFNTLGGDVDNKLSLLSSAYGSEEGISNPYGRGSFEKAFRDSEEACKILVQKFREWVKQPLAVSH